ncbi:ATP-binding protein [Thermocoleostomius sinensis A174]|uniref:ATP-binding protein n=2 Tax=Thermocoleostomius TaxID=3065395 RepID=A0A9E9CAS5_9CYAN|nr:ATP-binding protein [Thermocoleostomius sinensis A174]
MDSFLPIMPMPPAKQSHAPLPMPSVSEVGQPELRLESTLADLRLYHFQIEPHYTGMEVLQVFERYSALPGVVLHECGQFLGMVSRTQLLEFLIRPQGELFISQPMSVLHRYVPTYRLVLPEHTSILVAAQLALRRSLLHQSEPIVVMKNSVNEFPHYYLLDIHELNIAYWQIRGIETQVRYERSQMQMIQSEKMASLGRLVDGVAHEILDPVSFIWGNLVHLSAYTNQIMQLVSTYEQEFSELPPTIQTLHHEIELDYLRHDIPQTIASIRTGAERLRKLATSLQNFCHIDDVYPKPADLHEHLDGIVLLLKSRLLGEIEIVKRYGHLPPVSCYAGQLNQVFMNILTNAVNALLNQVIRQELARDFGHDSIATSPNEVASKPQIIITTQVRSVSAHGSAASSIVRWASVCIADNGPGLSAEKRQQLMDSFSVENRADTETSLAVSYQIVTAKHGGQFHIRSPLRQTSTEQIAIGTEFEILLPLM